MVETTFIYYRFNDDATDEGAEGLGYDLTEQGSPSYTTGKVGNAIDLESTSSQYCNATGLTGSELTKIRTYDLWVKAESLPGNDNCIFSTGAGSDFLWIYREQPNDHIFCRLVLSNVEKFKLESSTAISPGTWLHIILVTGTNGAKLYINGNTTPEDTDASTDVLGANTAIYIGQRGDGNWYWDGIVDNVGLFESEYTTAEVTESYNSGNGLDFLETGTNAQINIGDDWKEIASVKINIGDTWKDVEGMQINIGDSWKTIF